LRDLAGLYEELAAYPGIQAPDARPETQPRDIAVPLNEKLPASARIF
jgi:hypothetical protein